MNKEKKAKGLEALGALIFNDENYTPAEEPEAADAAKEGQKNPPPAAQLIVSRSKKGRGGKIVSLISGFSCAPQELEPLAQRLKAKLGTGGSVTQESEILIQGEAREKIAALLRAEGYKVKISG